MENLTMSSLDRLPASLEMLKWVGETAWVLGRPCWLEWNRNNWLEYEINRMALELLLDLLVSTSEKKNQCETAWQWLQELNHEAFKHFQSISVCIGLCPRCVSLCPKCQRPPYLVKSILSLMSNRRVLNRSAPALKARVSLPPQSIVQMQSPCA